MKPGLALLSSLAVLIVVTFIQTVASGQTPQPKGDSALHVKAIYDDSERPVRRAPVLLFSDDIPGLTRMGVTDARGEFSFKNLAAAKYHVAVSFPGMTNGGFSPMDRQTATEVDVNGTSSADVKIRVPRPGSITGKITYPDGEPTIGAQVSVLKKNGKRWENAPLVTSGAQTDDRGIFRIYPLAPGEYVVSVIEQSLVIEERDGGTMQTTGNKSLNPYYYGGASNYATATLIQVDAGREVNNINITLTERATYKITGSIVAGGVRLADTYLRLQPHDQGLSGPTLMIPHGLVAQSNKDGQWSFTDIPDGTYSIEIDSMTSIYQENTVSKPRLVGQRQIVTVAGADVSDIVISLTPGARISGTIAVDGDKPLPRGGQVSLEAVGKRNAQIYSGGMSMDLWSKGQFVTDGIVAGEHFVTVRVWDRDYYVKSITWNGKDLLRQPLKVAEGEEIKNVRIVLSRDVGTISGRLITEQGKKPLASAWFMLVPSDQTKWNRHELFISGVTDRVGGFKITGAPDEYFLVTQRPKVEPASLLEFLSEHSSGPRIILKPGEQSDVEIVVPVNK